MHFSLRYPYRVPFSDALCRPHGPAGRTVSTAVVLVDGGCGHLSTVHIFPSGSGIRVVHHVSDGLS